MPNAIYNSQENDRYKYTIAVVIPCYKVSKHILGVIEGIGEEVDLIYVVDDKCTEGSGEVVRHHCKDGRVVVINNAVNLGVGGATMEGYKRAIADGATIAVKMDGDGQMDSSLIMRLIDPILSGEADYTKGNRFFDIEGLRSMPNVRLVGNAVLSFMTKLSSGYWDLFDPTNGFTAIHLGVASYLPFDKVSKRYFFETDMLFRLNTLRAVVQDVPMESKYGDEVSNLRIHSIFFEFLIGHAKNFLKRIFYNYYLRNVSIASFELPLGLLLLLFGIVFGIESWMLSIKTGIYTAAGQVMISALPVITGFQLILAFINYDISSTPKKSLHYKSFNYKASRQMAVGNPGMRKKT